MSYEEKRVPASQKLRPAITEEQWEKMQEGLGIFNFGYYQFGYGFYIHTISQSQRVGKIVARLHESRRKDEAYWLEIYEKQLTIYSKRQLGLLLKSCGLDGRR